MPCYHPIPCWYSRDRHARTGKRGIVFNLKEGFKDRPLFVPCGKCLGCTLERARQWAVRCMHEAKMHDDNCFITLTYDEQNVPSDGSLRPRDYVLFMKKLRKKYGPVRFFHCGEYGDVGERPHHHALLFGFDFDDKSKLPRTNEKYKLYRSAELDRLWGLGFCTIGECNFESAGYVARYAMKKVGGKIDYKGRCPEYLTMSRRPGIGRAWFEKFRRDVYPFDEVIVDGVRSKPPRYYDNVLEKMEPKQLLRLKSKRRAKALHDIDGTGPRLIVREAVRAGAIRTLKRSLEV